MNCKRFQFPILFLLAAFFCLCGFTPRAFAQSATLYLSPDSGSFMVGSTFTVSVFLNTNGENANVVWADLKFPPEILQVTSPAAGKSFITDWTTPPNYSNQSGVISFHGGIPGGISASAGLVSSITFRAVASGEAKIQFSNDSKVLLNDGMGTDILNNSIGGDYQILVPPPEGPKAVSFTHPDPDKWYSDSSPAFSWEKESGVTGYSWSFSQNPGESPNAISDGTSTETSFNNVADGIWYFHIRQQKNGIWGQTTNVQVKIDTTPPEAFTPNISTYSKLFGSQTLVYFNTKDDLSGVDYYEVSLMSMNSTDTSRSFFTEEISPYKIPAETAGEYQVTIRAVDHAGNIRDEETTFRLVAPFITSIQGRGLEIKGVLFPWWLFLSIIVLLILALLAATVFATLAIKRRINSHKKV